MSSYAFFLNGFILNILRVSEIDFMFLFVMWPLDLISNGVLSTDNTLFLMLLVRPIYLSDFIKLADSIFFSKLTVNSNRVIFFSALLIRKISGLCPVVTISAGMVPPFIDCSGR